MAAYNDQYHFNMSTNIILTFVSTIMMNIHMLSMDDILWWSFSLPYIHIVCYAWYIHTYILIFLLTCMYACIYICMCYASGYNKTKQNMWFLHGMSGLLVVSSASALLFGFGFVSVHVYVPIRAHVNVQVCIKLGHNLDSSFVFVCMSMSVSVFVFMFTI